MRDRPELPRRSWAERLGALIAIFVIACVVLIVVGLLVLGVQKIWGAIL